MFDEPQLPDVVRAQVRGLDSGAGATGTACYTSLGRTPVSAVVDGTRWDTSVWRDAKTGRSARPTTTENAVVPGARRSVGVVQRSGGQTIRADTRTVSIDAPAQQVVTFLEDPTSLPRLGGWFAKAVRQTSRSKPVPEGVARRGSLQLEEPKRCVCEHQALVGVAPRQRLQPCNRLRRAFARRRRADDAAVVVDIDQRGPARTTGTDAGDATGRLGPRRVDGECP